MIAFWPQEKRPAVATVLVRMRLMLARPVMQMQAAAVAVVVVVVWWYGKCT
jgi:hypothetical protein